MKRLFLLFTISLVWLGSRQLFEVGFPGANNGGLNNNPSQVQMLNGFTQEEMLAEMKTTLLHEEALELEYDSTEILAYYAENVPLKVELLIKNKLIRKIRTKNICSIYRTWNIFSRCPSGYNAVIVAHNGEPTVEGWMLVSKGCHTQPISKFRYDVNNASIEARISPKMGYIPLDEFIILYKKAAFEINKSS